MHALRDSAGCEDEERQGAMQEPRFFRVRIENEAIASMVAEQRLIEGEYGKHPYLYPDEVKARWLDLNKAIIEDAKAGS